MPEQRLMTDEEKIDTSYQACLLSRAGDEEGYSRLTRTIPMPPYLAQARLDDAFRLQYLPILLFHAIFAL